MKMTINPKYNIGDKVYALNLIWEIAQYEVEGIIVYPNSYSYILADREFREENVFDSEESCRNEIHKSVKTLFK